MTRSARPAHRQAEAREVRTARTRKAKQAPFLTAFRRTGSVTGAAREAGVSRSAHYKWVEVDPEYAEQFENANEEMVDGLEQEARRRALEGVDEPVYYKGERVGSFRRYSDALLILLLRAKRPEQYRDSVDVNSRIDDTAAVIDPKVMKSLTDEELSTARALGRKLAGLDTPRKVTS